MSILVNPTAMTFGGAWLATYRRSIAFLIACPLVAAIPVVAEIVQHVAEVHIGMYDSLDAAKALELHPLRMGFGYVKMFALMVVVYFATRYAATGDARFAVQLDPAALRAFAPFLAFQIILTAAMELTLPRDNVGLFLAGFFGAEVIGVLVAAWAAAASLGNTAIGPMRSVRIMGRHLPWSYAFFFAAMLPLLVPHYAFGALALLGPKALLWPALIVDSLLVGWLAALLPASGWFAAARAAERQGVVLGLAA